MQINLKKTEWAFWVRAGTWSHEESALVLVNVIPDEIYEEYGPPPPPGWPNQGPQIESRIRIYGAGEYLDLLKRTFPPSERIDTRAFFEWCRVYRMPLCKDLLAEAEKIPALKVKKTDFLFEDKETVLASDGRGKQFKAIRNLILEAALGAINELGRDSAPKFFKPSGGLNVSALAKEIDDHRHRWPGLEGHGTSLDNILATLRSTVKERGQKRGD